MDELITVIIDVYNGEKFINKCLDSVINQTYKNLDILIIDDGSTDNTYKLIKDYKDKRIRVIRQKNMGLSLARNVGLDNAKGDYLYFIDIDDYIELDTIEYLYKLIKKYKTNISMTATCLVKNNIIKKEINEEKTYVIDSIEILKKVLVNKDSLGAIWNKLYKKEVFNNIRFEDRIINDVTIIHKIYIDNRKIAYSNLKKYYYIKHDTNITVLNKVDRSIDLYYAIIERYKYVKELFPNLIENEIGVLNTINRLYLLNKPELNEFLKEINAKKVYNEHFTLRILKTSSIGIKAKIRLILFRINSKICVNTMNIYLFVKRKIFRKY